jgi:sulfate adenylyltransferase
MPTSTKTSLLIPPCRGALVNPCVGPAELDGLRAYASRLPSLRLSERSACSLELLATGALSPLDRFMGRDDHARVLDEMRLADGHPFSMPLTLPLSPEVEVHLDRDVVLRDSKSEVLAIMTVEEVYECDLDDVARRMVGTDDRRHPLVAEMQRWGSLRVSGPLKVLQLPRHQDFVSFRLTPAATRARLLTLGKPNVVSFQTTGPACRPHEEFAKQIVEELDAVLLVQPIIGLNRPGDVSDYARVRSHQVIAERHHDSAETVVTLLPLATRLPGPRAAVSRALIARNYGANHVIAEQDEGVSGPDGSISSEERDVLEGLRTELGVVTIPLRELAYLTCENRYIERSCVEPAMPAVSLSPAEAREQYLEAGRRLPDWFARPEIAEILADAYLVRHRQGACVWFTGLSGAGKSTTAEVLTTLLLEQGRQITLLDGDVVRTHLSRGLGFSKADRDLNIQRIGFVASEIVRHGGLVIVAAVSPYRAARSDVRAMMQDGQFIEVFVDTPQEVCEARDAKGMYAKARRGEIKGFTGVDDPYERPLNPEIILDTVLRTPGDNARAVAEYLLAQGFLKTRTRCT